MSLRGQSGLTLGPWGCVLALPVYVVYYSVLFIYALPCVEGTAGELQGYLKHGKAT